MARNIMCFAVLIAGVLGCASSRPGRTEQPEDGSRTGESGFIEEFDPLSLNEKDIIVRQSGTASGAPDRTGATATAAAAAVKETRQVTGFRVQLLSVSDMDRAQEEKKKALFKFNERVYVEFESPLWKLRVGDFRTRKEADALRQKAVGLGYPDTWIVQTLVNVEAP
ncbi:SPOR domain-containing protein [bacterium]|nr:SPOR domain-containing protein [bacterium]